MKKRGIFIVVFLMFILVGCDSIMNTPTKKVEQLLGMYQREEKEVLEQLDNVLLEETLLTPDLKDRYRKLMKRQYQDLSYKVKKETIDGNLAIVEVEIEVYDYNRAIKQLDNEVLNNSGEYVDDTGNVITSKYNEDKITAMEEVRERITYTINFTVSKIADKWVVDDLTETERLKSHGLYAY